MITCLLLFDQTADIVASITLGVGSVLFMILFFAILWFDQRRDKLHWELDSRVNKQHWELQGQMHKEYLELRTMVWDAQRELRKEIRESEQRSRDALEKLRAPLTPDLEREVMSEAEWVLLLARGRAQLERIERKNRPNAGDAQQAAPEFDIDAGLKKLEETIASLTPSYDERMQRIDDSLRRILENLKRTREIQMGTEALLEGQ